MSSRENTRVGGNVYSYKAFISYTSRDSLFVDKLEEWLIDLAAHIDPVKNYKFFRDRTHSDAGENVEEGLKQSLEESEWLILVCSPSVNVCKEGERNWVDFECSYFANVLGRKEQIVSMIADTAPNDRNVAPFYPESVRDLHKKLAADMRGDKKWSQEVSRVYAEITEQSFESIYDVAQPFTGRGSIMKGFLRHIRRIWTAMPREPFAFFQKSHSDITRQNWNGTILWQCVPEALFRDIAEA